MTQVFEVSGMHCGGCAARVQRAATALAPGATALAPGATVTLEPPRLTLPEGTKLDAEAINKALSEFGDYSAKPLAQG